MLAADDGDPKTMAVMHEVKLYWNDQIHDTFTSIAQAAYQSRGGRDSDLPKKVPRNSCRGLAVLTHGSRSTPRGSCSSTARRTA